MVMMPTAERTMPSSRVNSTIIEKVLFASSFLPKAEYAAYKPA